MSWEVFKHYGCLMEPEDVLSRLRGKALAVEAALGESMLCRSIPDGLREVITYSLMAGGKRLRPVLLRTSARMSGLDASLSMPFAVALECIHTYSLIHDDLPAMDDDDLRRGKPSSHKKFGEAQAILAGDALLTDAFSLMASTRGIPAERVLAAIQTIAVAAGSSGMVGGQFLDVTYDPATEITKQELAAMHQMKTGALIRAACVAGAQLAGADASRLQAMSNYGEALGAAFQMIDDILDETGTEQELGKPIGSDAVKNKLTFVSMLGLARSRTLAREKTVEAVAALKGIEDESANFLRGLAVYMSARIS